MSTTELRPAFRQRFRALARQIWALHVSRGVALTALVAAVLLALAAAADYLYELPWLARAGLLLVCVALYHPEWRTALSRAMLAPTPYTTLTATPSATAVDEGSDVTIDATMSGRARESVVLHVREAGDEDWRQESMDSCQRGTE